MYLLSHSFGNRLVEACSGMMLHDIAQPSTIHHKSVTTLSIHTILFGNLICLFIWIRWWIGAGSSSKKAVSCPMLSFPPLWALLPHTIPSVVADSCSSDEVPSGTVDSDCPVQSGLRAINVHGMHVLLLCGAVEWVVGAVKASAGCVMWRGCLRHRRELCGVFTAALFEEPFSECVSACLSVVL